MTIVQRRPRGRRFAAAVCATILSVSLVHAQTSAPPQAPAQPAARPANVSSTAILIMIRSVLIALDQANKTGDYSVLRALGSPDFQLSNTPTRLAEIFANQRKSNFDLSNVAILDPQITLAPQIEATGMMHFAGFYPANGGQLKFEFLLQSINNQWILDGLAVNFAQAAADSKAAPTPAKASDAAPTPTEDTAHGKKRLAKDAKASPKE